MGRILSGMARAFWLSLASAISVPVRSPSWMIASRKGERQRPNGGRTRREPKAAVADDNEDALSAFDRSSGGGGSADEA